MSLLKTGALILALAGFGCAGSPTEESYGDAVRHTMAQQRLTPQPAPESEPTGDGRRIESVLSAYRTLGSDVPVQARQETR